MDFYGRLISSVKNRDGTYAEIYELDIYENDESNKIVATSRLTFPRVSKVDGKTVVLSNDGGIIYNILIPN